MVALSQQGPFRASLPNNKLFQVESLRDGMRREILGLRVERPAELERLNGYDRSKARRDRGRDEITLFSESNLCSLV